VDETARRTVPANSRPVRQTKATDVIIGELRRMVLRDGRAGDYLPSERVLVDMFKVSRPTLREAVRVLESEGLVEIRRGLRGGAIIREPSVDELARQFAVFLQLHGATGGEVYDLRQIVEPAAARLASDNPSSAQRLQTALAREAELIEQMASNETLSGVFVDFHEVIYELSANRALDAVGQLLHVIVSHHWRETLAVVCYPGASRVDALRESHAAHQRIARAIGRGNGALAERLMRDHLAAVRAVSPPSLTDTAIDILGIGTDRQPAQPRSAAPADGAAPPSAHTGTGPA
jgi:DNA-binding FadR family transcriptional regulator